MAFKFVVLAALVACAQGGALLPAPAAIATPFLAAPVARQVLTKVSDAEFDPNPQYSYTYNVADSITGDFKHQAETRDGDVVRGSYSLLESDGTRRVVDYAADALNGFNAVVRKEPAAVAIPAPAAISAAIPAAIPAPTPIAVKAALPAFPAPIARFAAPLPAALPVAAPALPYAAAAPLPLAAAPAFPAFTSYAAPGIFRSGPIIKSFY
ncbi:larval cuticle protein A3A-like [Phymastichus coffea]|uniref:larval cuticle protein A3A-like n=1 Tax=Phymastichus coffea TaxID=108790 RepID=UPI00273C26D7|nr:larval cuticle protein A3A-like [Phymastichus coffea]